MNVIPDVVAPVSATPSMRLPTRVCMVALVLMLAAAGGAWLATPRLQEVQEAPSLDVTVPNAFGDWHVLQNRSAQVDVSQGVENPQEQPYDQTVMRTYVNSRGEQVMLALAWGQRQRQDVKVHRPEVCYPAQGYEVTRLGPGGSIALAGAEFPVPTVSMLTNQRGSYEAVRYWIRIGDSYGGDGLRARWYILQEGIKGRIPDGILVRASQRITSTDQAQQSGVLMENFLTELVASVPPATRHLLVR
ncbi:MAG: EpsI family protein [Oxalobacteraceae bacterium]|nr:MAG: EpsI family protein [Oxalobacteraceae bacterium]